MPVGTVRGRVELDAPALRTLRELERQGIRTDRQMKELGRTLDRIADREDERRIRAMTREIGRMGPAATRADREVSRSFGRMRRNVVRDAGAMEAALVTLNAELDRLDGRNVSATVDLDGLADANAQITFLERRLDRLGRRRVTPRVALGGGFDGAPTPPTGFRGGGGAFGGGGRTSLRSIGLGPLNLSPRGGVLSMITALPVVQSLLGGATAVAGSAGMGALGAGALGVTGGGALLAGVAGLTATIKPMSRQVSEAQRAWERFDEVVQDFGRNSREAARAKRELDQAFARAPEGTRDLLRNLREIRREWTNLSRPGQEALLGLASNTLSDARRFIRQGGGADAANRISRASAREGARFSTFLTGRTGQRFARQGAATFDENLGNARLATQGGLETLLNIMQASRPFFREATAWLRDWMRGWARGTRDINATRQRIREMVDHLRSWIRLTRATGGLFRALLGTGAPEGQRAVDDLTRQLRVWEAWVRANPAQVREFFRETIRSSIDLARAIGRIVEALSNLATLLTPVLDRFSQLVALAGQLGLLTPGVATLAFGAYRGARGARGGPGGGGGAGGTTILPMGGGGGGAGGVLGGGARGGILGGAAAAGGLRGLMNAGRMNYGFARGFGGGRLGSAAQAARYTLAPGAGGLARGAGMAVRGAGKAFWPVALGMGVLDFASYDGNFGGRLQNALSGATLGLVSRPRSDAQQQDAVAQRILEGVGGTGSASSGRELRRQIRALRFMRGTGGDAFIGLDLNREQLDRANRTLDAELRARIRLLRQYRRDRNQILDDNSRQRAAGFFGELQEGFGRRSRRGGAELAVQQTITETIRTIRRMRRAGGRELAQMTLDWAREQARANPALQGQYDRLVDYVQRRFGGMRGNIRVVQGQILDGSRSQWRSIADAISSQARRGVDETSDEFRRLQQVAIGALVQMGWNRGQARRLMRGVNAGGRAGATAQSDIAAGPQALPTGGTTTRSTVDATGAQGGPSGDGIGDTSGGPSARGAASSAPNLMGAKPGLAGYAAIGQRFGLSVSSGYRAGSITSSGNLSHHASGNALDIAGPSSGMMAFARYMAQTYGNRLEELIYTPMGFAIKNGQRVAPYAAADHYDHVHVADTDPGGVGGMPMGGMGSINLRARRSRLGGYPGAMSNVAMRGIARGMEAAVNRRIGAMAMMPGGGAGPAMSAPGGSWNAGSLAQLWIRAGGSPSMARLMGAIGMAESSGNPQAVGIPTSGGRARGLWQIMWPLHAGKFPGMDPFNPLDNARMAVSILGSQGLGAWEAYTRGMHTKFLGSYRRGGKFVTRPGRGGWMQVGEGPNQEEVIVRKHTPDLKPALARHGRGSTLASTINVDLRLGGPISIREEADIERLADAIGRRFYDALQRERGASDEELLED